MEKFNTALILAGGKSTRMGFDKQTITLDGTKLIQKTISDLKSIFNEIIISTNNFDLYKDEKLILIKDLIPEKGPLGGIYSALKKSSSEYMYVIACDMPNINPKYIKYMMKILETSKYDACITRKDNWIESFNAFYSMSIIEKLEKHLKQEERTSNFQFINSINCYYVQEETARKFSPKWEMFANINTVNDLER
jgi:molybdopterin-guanine dinucleotide biosynthesis protein A